MNTGIQTNPSHAPSGHAAVPQQWCADHRRCARDGPLVSAACGQTRDSGRADTALFSRPPVECLGPGPRRSVWSAVGLLVGQPQPAEGLALDLRALLAVAPPPLALLLRQALLADLVCQLAELALERPLPLALGFLLLPAPCPSRSSGRWRDALPFSPGPGPRRSLAIRSSGPCPPQPDFCAKNAAASVGPVGVQDYPA